MYKNYFFLTRVAKELNEFLGGASISEAFCQDKDTLILAFSGPGATKYLEIQITKNEPWMILRDEFSRARRNVVDFFTDFLPVKIDSIFMAPLERTMWFGTGELRFAFIIHGNHTNFCLFRGYDIVGSFKNFDDESMTVLLSKLKSSAPADPDQILRSIRQISVTERTEIKKKFPSLGNEILEEFAHRFSDSGESPGDVLHKLVSEVLNSDLIVGINGNTRDLDIIPATFSTPVSNEMLRTEFALRSLREFVWQSSKTDSSGELFKSLTQELKKRISNMEVREKKLTESIAGEERIAENRNTGDLLAANIFRLVKGMKDIELEDFHHDGNPVKIALKEELTPQQNIDVFFKKARSVEQTMQRSREELPKIAGQLERLRKRYAEIQQMDYNQLKELSKMMEAQGRKKNRNEDQPKTIKFLIDGKYTLLVGKDSRNNDQLTLYVAKPEDFWFHARSVPGSHVVLQVTNSKDEIQKSVIKKAAAVAAFYSKAKNAGLVPVSFTKKKYVVKRKGMPPGQVLLMREESVMVKPGIPDGVEQMKDSAVDDLLSFE